VKKLLLILPFLLFFVSTLVYADDIQDGFDAYKLGDYKTAFEKFMPLAEQGDATAQSNLGLMYFKGTGVPQNYIEAHKWYNIAGANGEDSGRKNRDIIEKRMTPEQVAEAQRLAKEWMEKHQKN